MLGKLGLGPCHRLLDLFQRELQLVGIEPLRAAPEAGALQLTQEMAQPVVLLHRLIARRDRGIALRQYGSNQRAQRLDVVGNWFGGVAHAIESIRFALPARGYSMRLSQRATV